MTDLKHAVWVILLSILIFMNSCGSKIASPEKSNRNKHIPATVDSIESEPTENPRTVASMAMTRRGKTYLAKGMLDSALRILERAINLDPSIGENYFYMAQIWITKKNKGQAQAFHYLSKIYLKDKKEWESKLDDQKQKIEQLEREK